MKTYIKLLASLLIVCLYMPASAQKTADSIQKNKAQTIFFNAGLQYISNLTYAGRRDASSVPILLPTFTVITKQGFFASAIGYFDLNGSNSNAEGLTITPGYVFAFDKPNRYYGGNISATKYFITDKSPIILSAFDATIDGQLYANPQNIVKLTIGASYRFNKNGSANDIVNTAELSKEVYAYRPDPKKFNGLKFNPTITLYTGTQSFYQSYTTNSSLTGFGRLTNASPFNLLAYEPRTALLNLPTPTATQTREVRRYDLLALSGSLQATYVINKVQISFTPYLIQPYNQTDYATGKPMNGTYFLFTTGASVTF